jgi:hypothetical protein
MPWILAIKPTASAEGVSKDTKAGRTVWMLPRAADTWKKTPCTIPAAKFLR